MLIRAIIVVLLLSVCPSFSQSTPAMMTYQGRLTRFNGAPAPDGSYAMIFSIYPAATGGSATWTQTVAPVNVTGSLFSVVLGNSNSIPASALAGTPYLEIQVVGDLPMTPRQLLTSAPFAILAGSVPTNSITGVQIAPGSLTTANIAALDFSKLTNVPPQPIGVGWFNVTNYGAKGDGVSDDGPAIRSATAALSARGGGTLYFPAGIYRGTVAAHPSDSSYQAVLIVPGNTRIIGDGQGASVIGFLPGQPDYSRIILNRQIVSGGDENITLENLTLDGFALDQTATNAQHGLFIMRARNLRVRNVQFRNVFGTASSGLGEGFFAEFQLGAGAAFTDCECAGGSGNSASGFSADQATEVNYINCQAHDLTFSQAFTHNGCRHMTYVGCHAYRCPGGFNSEVSYDVTYSACTAGGASASAGSTTYPYPSNTPLSLTGPYGGFVINGSQEVQLAGCNSILNTNESGVWIQGANSVLINGGIFSSNKNYGIHIDSASLPTARLTGRPNLTGNSKALDIPGYQGSNEGGLTNPALPASGTALTNPFPMDVTVYVIGGSVSSIQVDGKTLGIISGTVKLPAGSSIKITYGAAPAWNWVAG